MIPGFTSHYKEDELHGDHQGALSSYECSHSFHSPTCHHPTRPKMHHGGVLGRVTTPHIIEVNENASKVKYKFYFSQKKSCNFLSVIYVYLGPLLNALLAVIDKNM